MLDAGDKRVARLGLDDKIKGPQPDAVDGGLDLAQAGNDQHRQFRMFGQNSRDQFLAGQMGHHEVHGHGAKLPLPEDIKHPPAVGERHDVVHARRPQGALKAAQPGFLVVDQQHGVPGRSRLAHAFFHPCRHRPSCRDGRMGLSRRPRPPRPAPGRRPGRPASAVPPWSRPRGRRQKRAVRHVPRQWPRKRTVQAPCRRFPAWW